MLLCHLELDISGDKGEELDLMTCIFKKGGQQ